MNITRQELYARLIPLIARVARDWEPEDLEEEVDEETRLIADLDLTSVDFVDLFVAIEADLGRRIGFHDLLMVDGRYIDDLAIGELIDYLQRKLGGAETGGKAPAAGPRAAPGQVSRIDAAKLARFREIVPAPGARPPLARKNRPALFVLSAPRSGSTLLQTMLAGNPALFAPPELHLLWFTDLRQRRIVYSWESNRHLVNGALRAIMELDHVGPEEAAAFMHECEERGMTTTAFYALLQERLGDRLLVDKTPSYAYSMAVLRRAEADFDRPLYLHLVRHPCAMVRSFIDAKLERTLPFMMRHTDEFSTEDFAELAWLTCNHNIVDFLRSVPPGRQHRIHYEDMVTDPQSTMKGVCDFLGVEMDPDMIDPYQDKGKRMADGVGTVSQMSGDLKFHLHDRIDPDAAGRWRRYMTEDAVSDLTWEFASTLGYERESRAGSGGAAGEG